MLADKIPGVTTNTIKRFEQTGHGKAATDTLTTYSTSARGTVQHLYEDLIDMERYDVAKVLEVEDEEVKTL